MNLGSTPPERDAAGRDPGSGAGVRLRALPRRLEMPPGLAQPGLAESCSRRYCCLSDCLLCTSPLKFCWHHLMTGPCFSNQAKPSRAEPSRQANRVETTSPLAPRELVASKAARRRGGRGPPTGAGAAAASRPAAVRYTMLCDKNAIQ